MTTFGIRGNLYKEKLSSIASKLIRGLQKENISFLVEKNLSSLLRKKSKINLPSALIKTNTQLVSKSNFIISIGGDGTFLYTAKVVRNSNVPIIGVNLGKLGFLAEIPSDKILPFIKEVLKGKFSIDERTVLQTSVGKRKVYGMNEVVIHQRGTVKTIEIQAYYNGQLVNSYLSDGLIVATPTGSTGYSLSAGGPIVNPQSDVIILSPICPHTLTARTIILPDSGKLTIKVVSKVPTSVTADGFLTINLKPGTPVQIIKAKYKIRIAKDLQSNYFKTLNQKLLWGEDVRKSK